ncbi:RNA pyrophosphohydrolase [Gimesia alba]|uniref:RNA pyrophosphohydrolase n=1 Tax=Gimesia alba TaxID=2527973 RepID=A0A517RAK9_9PLAN|nr:NUDIX domain-containing protein [Gimesia alba]QDT40915.1 RNA pyrophosphohydrolase [Gimesia alba]
MTDITVDLNGYRVNLRVAAIVTRGTEVLLCRPRGHDWWFLPGGRIKTNEDSHAALHRELTEEIGPGFEVIRPTVIVENFFDLDGTHFHELCTIYEVAWNGDALNGNPAVYEEVFAWFPREQLADIVLKPDFLKEPINNPQPGLQLIVNRDN